MTDKTPDAVREALEQRAIQIIVEERGREWATPTIIRAMMRFRDEAALDSRAGDAFDMPEYAPDDISHLEGLASYLDGMARDKGRARLPASKSLFEEIAKRLREYDVIRNATPASAVEPVAMTEDDAREILANAMSSKHWAESVRSKKDDDWGVIKAREAIAAIINAVNAKR